MSSRNALRLRTVALALAAALGMTTLAAPAAAADDDVVAVGRRVGDLCVFDDPVRLTGERMVTADESCRLVGTDDDLGNLTPTPTAKPKVMNANAPLGGDVPSISLTDADDLTGALKHERDHWVIEAHAEWPFYDGGGVVIYRDSMTFRYRRSRYDGSVSHITPGAGSCVTGGSFPYRPSIGTCDWSPGIWGGKTFSFTSRGHYETHVGLVQYDVRDIVMSFTSYYTDRVVTDEFCSRLKDLPVGWRTPGCRVGEEIILW